MAKNLLEAYGRQLKVADAYVQKNYGKGMDSHTALTTAVLLDNTNRFLTESMGMNTMATERADLGAYKKFCLNLTNIAVPSLIANDLVIVHPMTSYSGAVAYLEYQSRTNKGGIKKGDLFNGVFAMGDTTPERVAFTSQVILETLGSDAETALTPMAAGRFSVVINKGTKDEQTIAADAKVKRGNDTIYLVKTSDPNPAQGVQQAEWGKINADGTITKGFLLEAGDKIAYFSEEFQMEHVPAQDIPTIGPVLKSIPLIAEPRRIAVRYDQITAFQAKTDYGFSLDKQIAEQACGELVYEIDTEMVMMLYGVAYENEDDVKALTWSKTLPVGVSKFEHYNGFLEIVERAKAIIYNRTKKFSANYMVIAPDVLTVLAFVSGYTAAKNPKMNGPYKAGELNGLGVYVSPALKSGEFFFGLNGSDMMSSAAVYAPYMAIVPTQLLGTPDGGLAQGFSTWYGKALLNTNLVVGGKIVTTTKPEGANIYDVRQFDTI